jgi:hypothetical protein
MAIKGRRKVPQPRSWVSSVVPRLRLDRLDKPSDGSEPHQGVNTPQLGWLIIQHFTLAQEHQANERPSRRHQWLLPAQKENAENQCLSKSWDFVDEVSRQSYSYILSAALLAVIICRCLDHTVQRCPFVAFSGLLASWSRARSG